MEPISDDELQRVLVKVSAHPGGHWPLSFAKLTIERILARLDAAESRAADDDRMQQRIERLESKLDAWHDLYGSGDWRSVLAAEMEGDHE